MAVCMSVWCPQDADLIALGELTGTGLVTRTGDGTFAARTIVGTAPITVTNGDGVAGNPTISIDSGPWTAIDLSTGTVSISAPSAGLTWEIILFIASSEATTGSNMAGYINGETTTTNYWTQQVVGTNAASTVAENNSNTTLLYAGSTSLSGGKCFNRVLIPNFRDAACPKMMINTSMALLRAAGDAHVGQRVCYRTGASVGAVNDAVTSFAYTLPSAGTHAAGSYGYHRWVSA